jgi:hypothetical protein
MNKQDTHLVDEHLQSLQGMQEVDTDDFFYTRLMARMERNNPEKIWNFPLKPVWVVGTLFVLLAINGSMLLQERRSAKNSDYAAGASPLQQFASSYDQSIPSY